MCSILAVVWFRNPHRSAECQSIVVLSIQGPRYAVPVVEKGIRVHIFILKELVCTAMKSVRTRLGIKTLYATRSAAHFRRKRGSSHLELGKSIDGRGCFVKG